MLRILHVTREVQSDRRFGIGRSLSPVIEALERRGHHVIYLTQQQLGARALAWQHRWAARLTPLARWLFGSHGETMLLVWIERLNMGRLAAHVAAREGIDIVHLHDPWLGWGFRIGRWLYGAKARRSRWGITQHGFGAYSDAIREEGIPYTPALLRWNHRFEASLLRAAGWVVCPTQAARAQLARDLGLPGWPAHWHAVPHARPEVRALARDQARRQLGWSDKEWHVLAVGRINPVKRLDRLVQACLQAGRPWCLTLLSEGDAAPLRQAVADHAGTSLRLDVRVVDDVAPYLAAADVYVSSALNESFGLANLEAVVAGLPSVCTAVGGVPEVTGGAAQLLPGGDDGLVDRLASALIDLQDNAHRRDQLARAGRAHALRWPDAAAVAQRYESIYLSS
ncbi:MAG: glycosyltransferase family 4 protein [Burkholderiales bacterium]|nr:glycosyltransferase family 4 protein [Burkholderiales bacterium]